MNVGILIAYILIELVKNFRKTWLNPDFIEVGAEKIHTKRQK